MAAVRLIFQRHLMAMNYYVLATRHQSQGHEFCNLSLICYGNDILTCVLQIITWQEYVKASISFENLLMYHGLMYPFAMPVAPICVYASFQDCSNVFYYHPSPCSGSCGLNNLIQLFFSL